VFSERFWFWFDGYDVGLMMVVVVVLAEMVKIL
jgi:hypothetical protein